MQPRLRQPRLRAAAPQSRPRLSSCVRALRRARASSRVRALRRARASSRVRASRRAGASQPRPGRPRPHPPRRFERLSAELEVSLVSTSNFYLGFTENLSEGGLFVATYAARPLGSEIEISVRLPDRADALVLRGIVRWHRAYSATSDGYPGMGIQFDVLSETDKADIAAFLVTRPPLFFVD